MADARRALEQEVGHPGERWEELLIGVTDDGIREFREIEMDWLDLMWCLD